MRQIFALAAGALSLLFAAACSTPHMTNTARSAVEEALICAVVEDAVNQADLKKYAGKTVFMDYTHLAPQVNKDTLIAYFELHAANSKIIVGKDEAKADLVFQLSSGILATDVDKFMIGTPALPIPVPDTGINIVIPEIPLFMKFTRSGFARFFVTIIDAKTRKPVETIAGLNAHAHFINWVFCLIPFKTHSTPIIVNPGPAKAIFLWEE